MHPSEHSRAARLVGPLGLGAITILGALALSCFGLPPGTPTRMGPITLIYLLLFAAPIAAAYILGAFGLGRPLAALLAPRSAHRPMAFGSIARGWQPRPKFGGTYDQLAAYLKTLS